MAHDPHDFFGPAGDFSLKNEEKSAVWRAVQQHMAAKPLRGKDLSPADEQSAVDFFAAASAVALESTEKTAVRESLQTEQEACMYFSPARSESLSTSEKSMLFQDLSRSASAMVAPVRRTSWGDIRNFLSVRFAAPVFAAVVLIGAGAGITYASEYALPGHFLYRIKLLNENIRSGLQFSPESRAAAETDRVGRRLQEAETLVQTQKLTESASLTLDHEFRLERRRASTHILLLEQSGNAEAAARTRARLNALEDTYHKLIGRDRIKDENNEESSIGVSVSVASSSSAEMRSSVSSSVSSVSHASVSSASSITGGLRIEADVTAIVESIVDGEDNVVEQTTQTIEKVVEETVHGTSQSISIKQNAGVRLNVKYGD